MATQIICVKCGYAGPADVITRHIVRGAIIRCPKCHSINVRVTRVDPGKKDPDDKKGVRK